MFRRKESIREHVNIINQLDSEFFRDLMNTLDENSAIQISIETFDDRLDHHQFVLKR